MKEINMNLSKSTDPKCSSSNKIKKYNICSVNMYNDDAKKNNKIMQVQKQAQI